MVFYIFMDICNNYFERNSVPFSYYPLPFIPQPSVWFLSLYLSSVQFSRSVVSSFATPRIAAHQASLSITNSRGLPKPMSIESVMPSNHFILCRPLLLRSIFPSIRVFSKKSVIHIRWPNYWIFSFSLSSSVNIQDWFPLGLTGWISLQSKGLSKVFSSTTVQSYQFFSTQPSS